MSTFEKHLNLRKKKNVYVGKFARLIKFKLYNCMPAAEFELTPIQQTEYAMCFLESKFDSCIVNDINFIYQLQLAILENKISHTDIAFFYCDDYDSYKECKVTPEAHIVPFFDDFFTMEFNLILEISKARIKLIANQKANY